MSSSDSFTSEFPRRYSSEVRHGRLNCDFLFRPESRIVRSPLARGSEFLFTTLRYPADERDCELTPMRLSELAGFDWPQEETYIHTQLLQKGLQKGLQNLYSIAGFPSGPHGCHIRAGHVVHSETAKLSCETSIGAGCFRIFHISRLSS